MKQSKETFQFIGHTGSFSNIFHLLQSHYNLNKEMQKKKTVLILNYYRNILHHKKIKEQKTQFSLSFHLKA